MDFTGYKDKLSRQVAEDLDAADELKHLRDEFVIPTRSDLKITNIASEGGEVLPWLESDTASASSPARSQTDLAPSIYFCGNSLGLQPKRTAQYIARYLRTWGTQGVQGHHRDLAGAYTRSWVDMDEQAAEAMAPIVGARKEEVAIMQTLTANLHLLMASFYKPTKERFRILCEEKAFPSDHFAIESHLRHHGYDPKDAMLLVKPDDAENHLFSTDHILRTIDESKDSIALLLLPGIQFYTGQLFDIDTITCYAHERGITVGWDLAHAAGNVPLKLHDWNVDFAAWCTYKYLNSGPGCIGALFVHSRHGGDTAATSNGTDGTAPAAPAHVPRLAGWWGSSKASRFLMNNEFAPIAGAGGWQLSNPSALDTTSVLASLAIFNSTSITALRAKSTKLTGYLEFLLTHWRPASQLPYALLTPSDPQRRGAQISVRLRSSGLLEGVLTDLVEAGVILDERKPDVIRVAPTPSYNTFGEVWDFVDILWKSLDRRIKEEEQERKQ